MTIIHQDYKSPPKEGGLQVTSERTKLYDTTATTTILHEFIMFSWFVHELLFCLTPCQRKMPSQRPVIAENCGFPLEWYPALWMLFVTWLLIKGMQRRTSYLKHDRLFIRRKFIASTKSSVFPSKSWYYSVISWEFSFHITMDNNLNSLGKWLHSLELGKYHQSFLDNGYDDLEICKQLGDPDLDAIGVDSTSDRQKLLEAVKQLNDQGIKIEYHTLEEEPDDLPEPPPLDNENERAGSETPGPGPDHVTQDATDIAKDQIVVRFTKHQLMLLLKEKLLEDYIDLSNPPYTLQVGV